uniref:Uncharacterized protein n=1 Tax=Arundo donax TaxID=35708 RepID=A0A0A9H704_ARUDO
MMQVLQNLMILYLITAHIHMCDALLYPIVK